MESKQSCVNGDRGSPLSAHHQGLTSPFRGHPRATHREKFPGHIVLRCSYAGGEANLTVVSMGACEGGTG